MKRTLTAAAAVVAGSAGVVGFAGTAAAVAGPEFPAQLPVDNNVAKTAFHATGTVHSATKTVGDVVPMEQQQAGRSGGTTAMGPLNLTEGNPVGKALGGLAGDKSLAPTDLVKSTPIGDALPVGETLPAERAGNDQVGNLAGGVLDRAEPVTDAVRGKPGATPEKTLGKVTEPVRDLPGTLDKTISVSP